MNSEGHEKRDVNVRKVALAGAALLLGCLVALGAMGWLFGYFVAREARIQPPPSSLTAAGAAAVEPPEPRLQTASAEDLRRLRAAEDADLSSYAWIDEKAGVVRIPIDRAVDLLAERGLPARPWAADAKNESRREGVEGARHVRGH